MFVSTLFKERKKQSVYSSVKKQDHMEKLSTFICRNTYHQHLEALLKETQSDNLSSYCKSLPGPISSLTAALFPLAHLQVKRHHKQYTVPRRGASEVTVPAVCTKELLSVLLGWKDGCLVSAALALRGQERQATEKTRSNKRRP